MAKILKIVTNPNPILRKISEEIGLEEAGSKKMNELCLNMAETMVKKDGIGLAAPQIGKNIRAIVINTKEGPVFMINPKIKNKSLKKEWGEEGCLSVPGVFGQVKRHKSLICVFYNIKGEKNQMKAKGLLARVIQHEIDHLDGILFIDKAKDLKG